MSGADGPLPAPKITASQRLLTVYLWKASSNDHYDHQYVNVTTFTNFN